MRVSVRHLMAALLFVLMGIVVLPGGASASLGRVEVGAPEPLDAAGEVAADKLGKQHGVPEGEARRRIGRQPAQERLVEELQAELGGQFGGAWIDQAGGGKLKIGLVGSGADSIGIQGRAAKYGLADTTSTQRVDYAFDQLNQVADQIGRAIQTVGRPTEYPLQSGVLTDKNRVAVLVPEGRALDAEEKGFLERLQAVHGNMLLVETYRGKIEKQACFLNECDMPLRGGVAIGVSANTRDCTAGFIVRSRSDGVRYVMTAGHCLQGNNVDWWTWWENGEAHRIGPPHTPRVVNDFDTDAGLLRINNPSGWNPRPWVVVLSSGGPRPTVEDEDYPIRAKGTAASIVGEYVCKTGTTTLTECGIVTGTGFTAGGTGHLARVEVCTLTGDSGGPYYVNRTAYGIHSAGTSNPCGTAYYQGLLAAGIGAEDRLNVDLVLSP
jgi:Trypsin